MSQINIKIKKNFNFSYKFLNAKLKDMYCKHMIKNDSNCKSKANRLLNESCKIGYDICEWGLYRDAPSDLNHHLGIIKKMEEDHYNHAIRIVICKYSFNDSPIIWIDNLHSAIKYIRQYGRNVKLKNIPFYVIDISDFEHPHVYGYKKALHNNYEDILGAVSCAYKRFRRSNSKELISIEYTLDDLLEDNPSLLTLP